MEIEKNLLGTVEFSTSFKLLAEVAFFFLHLNGILFTFTAITGADKTKRQSEKLRLVKYLNVQNGPDKLTALLATFRQGGFCYLSGLRCLCLGPHQFPYI